jgi:hypothetical protein
MNHMKRGDRRARQNKYSGKRGAATNAPTQLRTNIEHSHQFRFVSTSATLTAIPDYTLLHALGVAATSATVGYAIRQSVRVNQIEIWAPPASQGAAATCTVLFPASQRSQAREVTDTSVSVATPAHVRCGPPAESLCAFWADGNVGAALFSLSAPPGSIIDVWVSMVDRDGVAGDPDGYPAVLVGATVGSVYYCSLDLSTSAGSIYKPIGLTTA